MSQQRILMKKVTLYIHCMCKELQQYTEDTQIEHKNEYLKHEERLKKECLKHEEYLKKEHLKCKKESLKDSKKRKKEWLERQNDFNKFLKACEEELHKLFAIENYPAESVGTTKSETTAIIQTAAKTCPKTWPVIYSDSSWQFTRSNGIRVHPITDIWTQIHKHQHTNTIYNVVWRVE